jgi:ParB family chromosome partitioning protein
MSKTRTGLGKGLSALIRTPVEEERTNVVLPAGAAPPVSGPRGDTVAELDITKIRSNPFQPRADFDQQALDELKESIRQKGIIQAVTVRRAGNGEYELISGERRIRASMELGLKTVPAYIIEVKSNAEMLELALIENLQREHLNPIEIAISYQRLMHDVGLTPEDVGHKVSKDRSTVVNFLRLLKLPPRIQEALRKSQLTMGHARALAALSDEKTQLRLFDQLIKRDLNVRQVENLVREIGKKSEKKIQPVRKASASGVESISDRIQQILATKVKVNLQSGGRGEIVIEFYSNDDLERLFDLFATIKP